MAYMALKNAKQNHDGYAVMHGMADPLLSTLAMQ